MSLTHHATSRGPGDLDTSRERPGWKQNGRHLRGTTAGRDTHLGDCTEFLDASFGLALSQLLWALGSELANENSVCLSKFKNSFKCPPINDNTCISWNTIN